MLALLKAIKVTFLSPRFAPHTARFFQQQRFHSVYTYIPTMSTPTPGKKTVYYGTFIHSLSLSNLDISPSGAIGVDESGRIAFIERNASALQEILTKYPEWAEDGGRVVRAKKGGFFFPGFVDTHIHAPQYPNTGLFGSTTLMDWLETYTFPTEASFRDLKKAKTIYSRVVNRTLSHGTTTAAYYATIHVPATNLLSSICLEKGQRAFVGRVCMDCMSPEYYKDESPDQAIEDTKKTIEYVKSIDSKYELVSPIITPRFAVSCTSELMSRLGELAKEENLPIQTHINENETEIELVQQLFPESKNYTDVYDVHGLLGPRTILAHAVHISKEELQVIKERGAKLSHCPVSNSALGSGIAKVRDMINSGVDVGLGTDVSGGYSPSVLEAGRQALLVSRLMEQREKQAGLTLSVEEVLYLATLGGAKVVGLEQKIGNFEVGKEWDALLVGLQEVDSEEEEEEEEDFGRVVAEGPVDIFEDQTKWEDRVAKWVYGGDDRNCVGVWVKGRLVYEKKKGIVGVEQCMYN